jgi:hypothetical protein
MANHDKDLELAHLDEQIEHPASALDGSARHLVEDLQRLYQTPAADTWANAESLRRVQSRLQARIARQQPDQEPTIVPLYGFARHKERHTMIHPEIHEHKPAWNRFTQTIGTLAAVLVVAVLVGSAVAVFALKNQAGTSSPSAATATALATPSAKLDCSHTFADPDISHSADQGEHAVCLQKLETPLSGSKSIYHRKITLIAAYADANRLLVRFSIDGQNASLPDGGIYLTYLSVGSRQLDGTVGGGFYYDQQKKQTFYLDSFDTTSLPANTTTLNVTATFLALGTYSVTGDGEGESASFTFTLPMQQEKHIVTLHQETLINGHRLTLAGIRVTASMTILHITSAEPLNSQSLALEATLNGSKSTFANTDDPTKGKWDPINGFLITSLEDFLGHPADAWTVSLISIGPPLGQGTVDIPFTF